MLELSESNIHLNATATNKLQAIEMAASALEQAGNVEKVICKACLDVNNKPPLF